MTTEEKLRLIEEVLKLKPGALAEDTKLRGVKAWDSLTILSLQIRLTAIRADLQFNDLFACETAGEICGLF